MNRKLKILIISFGSLTFLLLSLIIIIPLTVHPNQYKKPIAALMKELTGRKLTIHGDVELSLFPDLQIILRDLILTNAEGFGDDPMARVEQVAVGVKFNPLLSGRVEVDRAEISGLSLSLHRNAHGQANWMDILAKMAESRNKPSKKPVLPKSDDAKKPGLTMLSVMGMDILDANFTWRDEVTGMDLKVANLELKTGLSKPGRPLTLTTGLQFSEASRRIQGQVEMKYQWRTGSGMIWLDGLEMIAKAKANGQSIKEAKTRLVTDVAVNPLTANAVFSKTSWMTELWSGGGWWRDLTLDMRGQLEMDWQKHLLTTPDAQFSARLKANDLPPAGIQVRLDSELTADWQAQTLNIHAKEIEGPAGMRLKGDLQTSHLQETPRTTGTLTLERFDVRALLIALGRTIPGLGDGNIRLEASALVDFSVQGDEVALSRLILGVDDARLTGNLTLNRIGPMIRFEGEMDTLDLDRYLAMMADHETNGWPVDWLQPTLFLDAKLKIGTLVAAKGRFDDVNLVASAKEGLLTMDPLSGSLHGGRLSGKMRLKMVDQTPKITLEHTWQGVSVGPLLQEMSGIDGVSGNGDLVVRLEASGLELDAMTRSLEGEWRLSVVDGVMPGLDVVHRIRNGYVAYKRLRPLAAVPDETRFTELTATGAIEKGILINKDLLAKSPTLKMTGGGQVDLVQQRVDYHLLADAETALQSMIPDAWQYRGLGLPLQLRGSFDAVKKFEVGTLDFSQVPTQSLPEKEMDPVEDGMENKDKINRNLDQLEKKLGAPVDQLLRKFLNP